jgi:hypothetical protein
MARAAAAIATLLPALRHRASHVSSNFSSAAPRALNRVLRIGDA